jgi:hypothetical protein
MSTLWDMGATEFLERLADAMDSSRATEVAVCKDGCGTEIRRGVRCENCRRKRHAAAERARMARKKDENVA